MDNALKLQSDIRDAILVLVGTLVRLGKIESYGEEWLESEQKYIIDIAFNEGSPATMRVTMNVNPDV